MSGRATPPELAVIIPVLNEAGELPPLLEQLQQQKDVTLEIIVADGGSTDGTPERARTAGARVVTAPPGRAVQLNAGAASAQAPWLLFLHADCRFTMAQQLRGALNTLQGEPDDRVAGHWPVQFVRTHPGHDRFFRYLEGKTALNRPYTINGDQGLLIAARWFHELGGYDPTLPFLEDQRIAARIFAHGRWHLLPGHLRTSARRFEAEGHGQRYTLMAMIMGMHAAGVDEFFRRAPQVYALHEHSGRLDLQPYVALVRELLARMPLRRRLRTALRLGRFVRENAWQLAYARDVRRGDERLRCLARYDRWLNPLIAHRVGDAGAALLTAFWFYAWLPRRLAAQE